MVVTHAQSVVSFKPAIRVVGRSSHVAKMQAFAERAAKSNLTILLTGETGSGKDHFAEYIHNLDTLALGRKFISVNCAAIPEHLLESELFGHEKGAYTDACTMKRGLIQAASGGTLFLNEVANMSLNLQAKILAVAEKRSFRAVGSLEEVQVNTRIIAATNADLAHSVKKGQFRSDLYHRLNVVKYNVPALRERPEDIFDLAHHFLVESGEPRRFSSSAITAMNQYSWPGNIRELASAVSRAIFSSSPNQDILPEHLELSSDGNFESFEEATNKFQKEYFEKVLKMTRGNITAAAKIAGITDSGLHQRIRRHELQDFIRSLTSDLQSSS